MMNKTYKTLTGAYTSAQNAGAKSFGVDYYAYANRVDDILAKVYTHKNARILAKCNLFKLDKQLLALEFTKADGYKWTAIGHFDSEGLLYPIAGASEVKQDKVIEPRTRKSGTWANGTPIVTNVRGGARKTGKGKVVLGKADKKAIRSECYKLAKGDRDMYDALCKERGVDNHR